MGCTRSAPKAPLKEAVIEEEEPKVVDFKFIHSKVALNNWQIYG